MQYTWGDLVRGMQRAPMLRLASATVRHRARGLASGAAQLTRLQRFKEHVYALHTEDPVQWSDRTLSRHFGVPLERMQALLTLQQLEEKEGPVNDDDIELADDVEELLTPDDVVSAANARRLASLDEALARSSVPDVFLLRMSDAQEDVLVGELAARLGVSSLDAPDATDRLDAAASALIAGLSARQRTELAAAIRGDMEAAGGESGSGAAAEGHAVAEGPADSAKADAPAPPQPSAKELAEAQPGSAGFGAAAGPESAARWPEAISTAPGGVLGLILADADRAASVAAAAAGASNAVGGMAGSAGVAVRGTDTGVLKVGVTVDNPRGIPKFMVKPDLGPDVEMYLPKRLLQKLQRVRVTDTADALASSLEKRQANLFGDKTRRRKTGDFVFVDAGADASRRRGARLAGHGMQRRILIVCPPHPTTLGHIQPFRAPPQHCGPNPNPLSKPQPP